jgi:hypothetical protein
VSTLRPRIPLPRSLPRVELKDLVPPAVSRWSQEVGRLIRKSPGGSEALESFSSPLLASFSEHGEDLWLDLVLRWQQAGFYVGVGGGGPRAASHSYRFYRRGWSGVNVEPTPREQARLQQQRPRDVNLQATIGVATTPLTQVFDRHVGDKQVDFLTVDAGEATRGVLESLDWDRHRPSFVLVRMSDQRNAVVQALQRNNYGLLMNNHVNGLFVDVASPAAAVRALLEGR